MTKTYLWNVIRCFLTLQVRSGDKSNADVHRQHSRVNSYNFHFRIYEAGSLTSGQSGPRFLITRFSSLLCWHTQCALILRGEIYWSCLICRLVLTFWISSTIYEPPYYNKAWTFSFHKRFFFLYYITFHSATKLGVTGRALNKDILFKY